MNPLKKLINYLKASKVRKVLALAFCFALIRLLTGLLVWLVASGHPETVRKVYSEGIFPVITAPMKFIASLFPFSVGETLLLTAVGIALSALVFCIVRWIMLSARRKKGVKGFLRLLAAVLTLTLLAGGNFFIYGGLNYRSLTFKEVTGLGVGNTATEKLEQVCIYLGRKATEARRNVSVGEDGVVFDTRSNIEIFRLSPIGFENASAEYSCLKGNLVSPKPALFSDLMSYQQIAGIFPIVYTESIVNTNSTAYDMPFVACHELAHQLGFMQEDEANFIGYLAAISGDDPLYVYSGYYNGFSYAMNKLHSYDPDRWSAVWSAEGIDAEGISNDMRRSNEIWNSYKAKAPVVSKISDAVNDTYLKANDIKDGTHSYGRMVDLLIAYCEAKGIVSD